MILSMPDFTKPELDYIRKLANFTEREERLFDLRSKDIPHERCAEIMNFSLSTEKRINKKMINKILKLL